MSVGLSQRRVIAANLKKAAEQSLSMSDAKREECVALAHKWENACVS